MKGKSTITLVGIFLAMVGLTLVLVFGIRWTDSDGNHQSRLSVRDIRQGLDLQGGVSILYQADIDNPTSTDMEAANALLRARLDARNYLEATTATEGTDQIRVDIPGVADAEAAVAQIGASAVLMFTNDMGQPIVGSDGTPLTGARVANARPGVDGSNVVVLLEFDSLGASIFAEATRQYLGRSILIWMDDELLSSPTVRSVIYGGAASIDGNFTSATATLLAQQITQGSLPFGLTPISTNLVGARLGVDALNTSIIAGIIGFLLVLIFMAYFYKTMGLAADIALGIYVLLFLFIISGVGITVSLPGIAGLILSIGMATDANVVIFERIREEVANGKQLRSAMRTGYRRALPAVMDSNITTLIAGIVLWQLGTGPIMGFAQMLIIGILLSMFTSMVVTRVITNCFVDLGIVKASHAIGKKQKEALVAANGTTIEPDLTEKPFVQKRFRFFAFSGAILALGIAFAIFHSANGNGFFNLDVEFAGGTSFTVDIGQPFQDSEIEDIVRDITGDSSPQVQAIVGTHEVRFSTTETGVDVRLALVDALTQRFDLYIDAFTYSDVSPAVSAAMRRSAIIAIIVSSLGMLLYISIRFRDLRKGAAAVLAQLHDAAIVLCVYMIFRIPLNYAFIAVMLTTLGYSINSTIIIFDRIRENRVRLPKVGLMSLINLSATQTLRRTLISTLSSFIAVFMLYVIGVAAIRDFTLPIMVGLLFGAYSSICLSGSAWFMMNQKKKEEAK